MSYILDALRRADSERERGHVPSLHSKQMPDGVADDETDEAAAIPAVKTLWWAVGLLALTLGAVLLWLFFGRAEPAPAMPAPVAVAPQAVTPAPAQPVQPAFEAQAPAPPPAIARAPGVPAIAQPPRPAVEPKTDSRPAKPAVKAASPGPQPDPEAPVPSLSDLPDNLRRQIPQLTVSGASYSKNPGSRMLILNGQVFREGDKVSNELVLEQIRLKSAVFVYRGQRFSLSF